MRRTSLSSKLLLAALPLIAAIAALLAVTVLADLDRVEEARRDATLGTTWGVLLDASQAVTAEQAAAIDALRGTTTLNVVAAAGTPDADTLDQASTVTDDAIDALIDQLANESGIADLELNQIRGALSLARQLSRSWAQDPSIAAISANSPFSNYTVALRELHTVGRLLQSSASDPEAGRTLLGVAQLSDANLASGLLTGAFARYELQPGSIQPLIDARAALNDVITAYDQFDATTTAEWAAAYRQAGIRSQMSNPQSHVSRALNGNTDAIDVRADLASTYASMAGADALQRQLLDVVIANAQADADDIGAATRLRLAIIAGAVLVATLLAWLLTRSITRRVRAVARNANAVATEQLPALVDALRDPRGRALPEVEPVNARGSDELAELATSFNSLQRTLHDVAAEQVAVLRRGVSDIFVTMARRNRSLVDRQLALLDEFEAEVEDPDVLSSYYHLDHLATRMRRNSESLLVLANAEPRRGRVGPTEVGTVMRASIGEVEEYRRIEIEDVEPLRVRGNVVADIAHLLAELLDNATAFSPPESLVQVGGRRVDDGYLVRIIDSGVGIGEQRLAELNELLRNPPIVGLSVEPTLGMSVVSLLAQKHGIEVTLIAASPGLKVDVLLPPTVFADGEASSAPTAAESDGAAIGDLATAIGLPTLGDAPVNGSHYSHPDDAYETAPDPGSSEPTYSGAAWDAAARPDHFDDDRVLAALEADLAAPEPGIDPHFTARLTDAFERSDLASITGDVPVVGSPGDPVDELPVRAGGAGAANAFQSFRAGARAATEDLAAANAPAASAPDEPARIDPLLAPPVRTEPGEVPANLPSPAFPAPSASSASSASSLPAPALPTPAAPPVTATSFASGELDRLPAPPQLPVGPSTQPVAPAHARPAPRPVAPAADLPTRNRAAAAAAFSHPDEAAGVADALAAFDQPPPIDTPPEPALPTRNRAEPSYTEGYGDDPTGDSPEVTAVSPLGADQLRARLRAFQSEFRTGQQTGRDDDIRDAAGSSAEHVTELSADQNPGADLA
ncbi:MAG TPA: ATP-binding protein [Ilumatobacter sp.]|nr:ATP-binding protein [Ilumatobacter sp.]